MKTIWAVELVNKLLDDVGVIFQSENKIAFLFCGLLVYFIFAKQKKQLKKIFIAKKKKNKEKSNKEKKNKEKNENNKKLHIKNLTVKT